MTYHARTCNNILAVHRRCKQWKPSSSGLLLLV